MAKKVKAIPRGYHSVTPHLVIRDAAKAIPFYKKAFAAKEIMRMPGPGGSIMHAEIRVGDSTIMLADETSDMGSKSPAALGGSPVGFYVYVENLDATWKKAVAAGAKILMPLTDMFWGDRMGRLEDPFGHSWSLASHVKDVTPAEIKKAQKAFLAQQKS
jgi:PhnB protein